MNTLNWICSKSWSPPSRAPDTHLKTSKRGASADDESSSYNDIAERFSLLHSELSEARQELTKANASLARLRQEAENTKVHLIATNKEVATLRSRNANQQEQIRGMNSRAAQMKQNASNANNTILTQSSDNKQLKARLAVLTREQVFLQSIKATSVTLQSQNRQLLQANNDLAARHLDLEKRHGETLFELEHFKCVEMPDIDIKEMPLLPQPFVVVLVDGDAYAWNSSMFSSNPSHNAGAFAATQMQRAVEMHLSMLPEVSLYAKVVARVFINDLTDHTQRVTRQAFKSLSVFRRHFTEALPLFDFFDSGRGKERADSKIKENFQLYLSNPHCQHIFLAVCTDNGFARMLEPYRYHEVRSKITLVSPGHTCVEIEALGFSTTMWPEVFARRDAPQSTREGDARRAARKAAEDNHNNRLGFDGRKIPWISAFVSDLVEEDLEEKSWTVKAIHGVSKLNADVGVRSLRCREALTAVLGFTEDSDCNSDEDDSVD